MCGGRKGGCDSSTEEVRMGQWRQEVGQTERQLVWMRMDARPEMSFQVREGWRCKISEPGRK